MSLADVTDEELDALHDVQLSVEHVYRAYGHLLAFHHTVGHAMDRLASAEGHLREADQPAFANELRDHHLPAGVVDDRWSYEMVENFERGFLREIAAFERALRESLADGQQHVSERAQQRRWRRRARDVGEQSDRERR